MSIQPQNTSVCQRNRSTGQRGHDKTPRKTHACLVPMHALLGLAFSPWSSGGILDAVSYARAAHPSFGISRLHKTTESTDRRYQRQRSRTHTPPGIGVKRQQRDKMAARDSRKDCWLRSPLYLRERGLGVIGVKRMGIERSSTLPPRPAKLGEVASRSEAGEGHFGRTPHPNLLLGRPRRRGRIFPSSVG